MLKGTSRPGIALAQLKANEPSFARHCFQFTEKTTQLATPEIDVQGIKGTGAAIVKHGQVTLHVVIEGFEKQAAATQSS